MSAVCTHPFEPQEYLHNYLQGSIAASQDLVSIRGCRLSGQCVRPTLFCCATKMRKGRLYDHTFICVLIEAPKGIDLVVPAICDRRIDKTGRSLSTGPCDLRPVSITTTSTSFDRTDGHLEGHV